MLDLRGNNTWCPGTDPKEAVNSADDGWAGLNKEDFCPACGFEIEVSPNGKYAWFGCDCLTENEQQEFIRVNHPGVMLFTLQMWSEFDAECFTDLVE